MTGDGPVYAGTLGILQCVLPSYRAELYREIASRCAGGLTVLHGDAVDPYSAQIDALDGVRLARTRTRSFLPAPANLHWQDGVVDWLEREDPDALLCEANVRYLSTHRAIDWMHDRGRPVLGWGFGTLMLSDALPGVRNAARLRYWSRFDAMVSYGSRGVDEWAALGLDRSRLHVAHNAAARRPPDSPPALDGRVGVPRVLYVGRINRGKKVDLLIRAALLAAERAELRLELVGACAPELLAELRALAEPLGDRVTFHGGLYDEALDALYARSSLFVMPGLGGLGMQTAMAHALPIVVAESDGTHLDLVDDSNGWVVEPDDPDDFAGAILAAVTDPEGAARRGLASWRKVRDTFNVERSADGILAAVAGTSARVRGRAA